MTNIVTPQSIKGVSAVCTLAKTVENDNTNTVALFTATSTAAALYGLTVIPRGTGSFTATQAGLYRVSGGVYSKIRNILLPAKTLALTDAYAEGDFGYSESKPLRLSAGDSLYVAISVAWANGVVFDAQYEQL